MSDEIDVGVETKRIYDELKAYGDRVQLYGEASEMNTYFRVSANLLERLLDCQERAAKLKEYRQFTDVVLRAMEDFLSPSQRNEFMRRLEKI